MGWRLRLSDKTVRKFAELHIYCQRQKCSPGIVVSGSIRFMQIFAGVRWRWGVEWECGSWKWRFSLLSFTVFQIFYTHSHTRAFRWYDYQWPWTYFKVIGLFHIKFLKNGVWYGKSYYRILIGNHALAFDWCDFWWPRSTFEGHFSLGCHFHVHFCNPWHAFASHSLPAIAELLVSLQFHVRLFKLAVLVYKCLNGHAPAYSADDCRLIRHRRAGLRSSSDLT